MRVSVNHEDLGCEQVGTVASAGAQRRLPGCNDRPAVRSERNARVAHGLDALQDIPDNAIRCDECGGDPTQYRIDLECDCPTCLGRGYFIDPDANDASDVFDARREFGTMPRLHGRGRGQL